MDCHPVLFPSEALYPQIGSEKNSKDKYARVISLAGKV
jgi:hypothetical protein